MALDKIKTDVIADDAVTVAKVAADTGITDKYHKVPVYANNAARDHNTTGTGTPAAGMIIFNTADAALQQYTGTEWAAIAPAPTFTGFSGTPTINEDDNTTVVIQGSQFIAGMTVALHNNSGEAVISGHGGLSYVLNSSSQITVTVPSATSNITAGLVLFFKITKSGLSVSTTTITVNADPTWASLANPFANAVKGKVAGAIATLPTATASTGGAIAYTLVSTTSSTSNTYAINSSSGAVTNSATLTGPGSGNQTDVLVARATGPTGATQANDLASINIIVHALGATGGDTGGDNTPTSAYATYTIDSVTYRVHRFTSGTTNFVVNGSLDCDILVIGGGGSGASQHGGGGGAGALVWAPSYNSGVLAAATYSIVIGPGGASVSGQNNASSGTKGTNTTFGSISALTAEGGGNGGGYLSGNSGTYNYGGNGGSGGGAGNQAAGGSSVGGTGSGTLGGGSADIKIFGGDGGNGSSGGHNTGGGGGGAGANGQASDSAAGGNGYAGDGGVGETDFVGAEHSSTAAVATAALLWAARIGTNSSNAAVSGLGSNPGTIYIAGGGGGGTYSSTTNTEGAAGVGGGGIGARRTNLTPAAGLANTGGGGGGTREANLASGAGGSGVVLIRYAA